jgi:F0F1-type ATP synthase assembly protein I
MFPVSITLGAAIGYFLDTKLGTLPWLSGIFLLLGIAAAFLNLIRLLNKFDEFGSEDQNSSKPSP